MAAFLGSLNIEYIANRRLEETSYRPDFILPKHKLIIEVDGLYWHSDAKQQDNSYHVKKLKAYETLGYRALFFRENELTTKFSIVQGMILSRLGLSPQKYMARKLSIGPGSLEFMTKHHLMGKGAGRRYSLFSNSVEVAQMQVKWNDKAAKILEISSFATDGSSVAGGFSRLLKHIEKVEEPHFVKTFVDRRYDLGGYLPSLGFEHKGTHKSFVWIKQDEVLDRLKFRGDAGYSKGYNKLWDCGQAKFIKTNI